MTPYYQDEAVTLYCGDCREILPSLSQIDVTITDPPFGEKTHQNARSFTRGHGESSPIDFHAITQKEFFDITAMLMTLTKRWVVMHCEWRYAHYLEAAGWLVRLGVFVKVRTTPQLSGDRPGTGWEAVAILHRAGRKRWNGGGKAAVWRYARDPQQYPTQKPLALLREWVSLFSDPGETILDPFCGSGTTLCAAKLLGRRAIGIDRREQACALARERVQAVLPLRWKPVPVQETLPTLL